MAAAAVPLMIAQGVIGAAGALMQAQGQAEAANAASRQKQRQAYLGRIAADQTDTAYREELTTTLANIEAVRAVTGTSQDAPTGMAIAANEARVSGRERRTRVQNLISQASADEDASRLYARQARSAMFGGVIGAFGSLIGMGSNLARMG